MGAGQVATKNNAITFVLFTFNEERRIEWAIKNFLGWGKILIVDNYSEDKTVEIARSYGCDVLLNKNKGWVEDPETVANVWAAVQTEWIYWGFADEMADAATLDAITTATRSGKYSIVNVVRKNFYYGKFLHDAFADGMNRIFQKQAIDFSKNTIHQFGEVTVPKSQICCLDAKKFYVRHFISNNASSYLRSLGRYAEIDSSTYTGTLSKAVLGMKLLKIFIVEYLLHGGYRSGFPGFAMLLQMMNYRCLIHMNAYESRNDLDVQKIEMLNDEVRKTLLPKVDAE
jgi:glycosyltransferase involved in cell wall biosynthesis